MVNFYKLDYMNKISIIGFVDTAVGVQLHYHNEIQDLFSLLSPKPGFMGLFVWDRQDEEDPATAYSTRRAFIDFKVDQTPTLIFTLHKTDNLVVEVARFNHFATQKEIVSKFESLVSDDTLEDIQVGPGGNGSNTIINSDGRGTSILSFPIFNLPFTAPSALWLLIAGYSGYKLITKGNSILYGSTLVISGLNYFNKRSNGT